MKKRQIFLRLVAAGIFLLLGRAGYSQTLAATAVNDSAPGAHLPPKATPVLADHAQDPGSPGEQPKEAPKMAASSTETLAMPPGNTPPPVNGKPKE